MSEAIPPPRRARTAPGRKPRQPKIKADEKAAIDENAKQLAREINARLNEIAKAKPSKKYDTLAERRAASTRRRKQLARKRGREGIENPVCKGFRWDGQPCKLPPLIVENWEGPNEPTGLYCVHHDPNITRDETEAYILHGSPNKPLPRKVTPGELAHILVQRSPELILAPYLKALGLVMDEEGNLVKKRKGLVLHGFSRGGEVIRSPYEDLAGQIQVAEKLFDRVYGRPRQAVDLASQNTTVSIKVDMTAGRVDEVTKVLQQSGAFALGNGNGNGHSDIIESTAEEVLDT